MRSKNTNLQTTPRLSTGERKYEDRGSDVVESLNSYLEKLTLKTTVEAESLTEKNSSHQKPGTMLQVVEKQRRSSRIIYSTGKQ